MTRQPDAVVVGAGIVGAACALALAREGLRVLSLDGGCAGGGATAAGMGHLVVMDDSEPQMALTAYSLRLWSELAPALPADCEDDPCGTLWLADGAEEMAQVEAKARYYRAHGVAAEVLDAAQLAAAEPNLRPGLAGALRVAGDRVIYPPNAARFLLARAADLGAQLWERFHVSRLANGQKQLESGSKPWQLAALFVRLFRSLDAIVGSDDAAARAWLRSDNAALGGVPGELMREPAGLVRTVDYLDAARARI